MPGAIPLSQVAPMGKDRVRRAFNWSNSIESVRIESVNDKWLTSGFRVSLKEVLPAVRLAVFKVALLG